MVITRAYRVKNHLWLPVANESNVFSKRIEQIAFTARTRKEFTVTECPKRQKRIRVNNVGKKMNLAKFNYPETRPGSQ